MASMRDIKRRKSSIQSTQQITKAMKLVATVKLQKAKRRAEQSKDYFNCMYSTVSSMLKRAGNINHPYLQGGESGRKAVIMITSNRGLAGGYNNNVVKLVTKGALAGAELDVYALGKKGRDAMIRKGYQISHDASAIVEEPSYPDAVEIGKRVLKSFSDGEVGEIYLAYTGFKNTVVHEPKLIKLLPIELEEEQSLEQAAADNTLMTFEPEEEEALNLIVPKYVNSLIHGALVESVASENGARMQAMESATNNAEEMIGKLELQYNRARQGSITQELTEIIAGADAIS